MGVQSWGSGVHWAVLAISVWPLAVVGSGSEWLFLSFCVYFLLHFIDLGGGGGEWAKKRREEGSDCAKLSSALTRVHKGELITSTHELLSILLSEGSTALGAENCGPSLASLPCLLCSSHSTLCCSSHTPWKFLPGGLEPWASLLSPSLTILQDDTLGLWGGAFHSVHKVEDQDSEK